MKGALKSIRPAGFLLLGLAMAVPNFRGAVDLFCAFPVLSSKILPMASAAVPPQIFNRDPLTEEEANLLRETAALPDKRLEALVEFATARMTKVEEALQSKPAATRGQRVHDALDQFARLMDEIDDNVDDYEKRKMDMRKGLAKLIEADVVFQSKLTDLALAAQDSPEGARDYEFVLQDAIDIVNGQLDFTREVMKEQERRAEEEKERKKKQPTQMDRDYQTR